MTRGMDRESTPGVEAATTLAALWKTYVMDLERCIGRLIPITRANGLKGVKTDKVKCGKVAKWSKKGSLRMEK
jgi:hypothetical protein